MTFISKNFLVVATLVPFGMASAAVSIDSTSWSQPAGTASLSGASSSGLVWGNGSTNNADNSFLFASVDGDTLVSGNQNLALNVGQTVVFTGTVNLAGVQTLTTGSNQFRFGLFNENGSSPFSGWLGYFVGNGTTSTAGGLYERNNPNTAGYIVETGASQLASYNGGGANLTDGFYSFSMSLQRTASGLVISASMIRTSDGVSFINVSNVNDSTPGLTSVNRIGFLAADGLDADRVTLSNLSINVIPEPSSLLVASLAGGLCMILRRRP